MTGLRKGSVLLILFVIAGLLAALSPEFLTLNNLLTVALQTSIIGLVAVGMTFTILTGGIDLSVGSVVALCGVLAAGLAVRQHLGSYPAILIALAAGALLGGVSGALIVWGRIPPFVATLAMMAAARGLTLVYTEGRPIAGLDGQFTFWGTGDVAGIPMPVIVMALAALAAYLVLTQTAFGLHVYAVGGGEETARLASVPSARVKLRVYVISGMCAALAGVILAARLWSAQPNASVGLELDAIAAAVLGGTSLAGGTGGVGGTVAGAFIIGVLSNGLNLLEVPSYNQQVVKGLVFIVAVLLDYVLKRRWQPAAQTPTA
ncbi:MAG TPA: ribose ABC transporter permease [Anaerolineae bacterium]|nr:ribose ABC transporter permease [Anaerolineae bacterium]